MKISIGYKIQDGPWGGGNNFVLSLSKYLQENDNKVINHLNDDDIDIILIIDPRRNNPAVTFSSRDIVRYLSKKNNLAIVVHRINECDERKNTKTMNMRLKLINYTSDHTVFIGSWLKDLNLWNPSLNKSSVILNGADKSIFNMNDKEPWNPNEKLRLVTHHWAGNKMKGFDVYSKIDEMLTTEKWNKKISFTYIGNLPNGFKFNKSFYYPPMQGKELADELKKHHVYITGSLNEPAGMHHIEGAMCGLPILYRNSGSLSEYCSSFGLEFTLGSLSSDINRIIANYDEYFLKIFKYPYHSKLMCDQYLKLFDDLHKNRESIIKRRFSRKNYLFNVINAVL